MDEYKIAKTKKRIHSKQLKKELDNVKQIYESTVEQPASDLLSTNFQTGYIELSPGDNTKSYKLKQSRDIIRDNEDIDLQTKMKFFNLNLSDTLGPYNARYSSSGKFLLLAGRSGHFSVIDLFNYNSESNSYYKLVGEDYLQKTKILDSCFLNNINLFSLITSSNGASPTVSIYDYKCTNIHSRVGNNSSFQFLGYLPYHYLLTMFQSKIGNTNSPTIYYFDVSTGQVVRLITTKSFSSSESGSCMKTTSNESALSAVGTTKGNLLLYTPSSDKEILKLHAHNSPILSVAFNDNNDQKHLATCSLDGTIKVWDIRYGLTSGNPLQTYFSHTHSTSISLSYSQTGMLAVGGGKNVTIWDLSNISDSIATKNKYPYLTHQLNDISIYKHKNISISNVEFRPYEDVLGIGHSHGFGTMLTPGTGQPNYDSLENDLYPTKKGLQNRNVTKLLEKLPFDVPVDLGIQFKSDTNKERDIKNVVVGTLPKTISMAFREDNIDDTISKDKKKKKRKRGRSGRGNIIDPIRMKKREQQYAKKLQKTHKSDSSNADKDPCMVLFK